ncbi:MAG: cbb3-type cytochrome c oxidase N-terminal domain-containing protein [Candidatus Neomarinimicrobiota bacterium]
MTKPRDKLLSHNYDGIREFDNDLPGWWKALFYLSILFAGIYLLHYHVLGTGDLPRVEYLKELDPEYVERAGPLSAYHSPYFEAQGALTPRVQKELDLIANQSFELHLMQAMAKADGDQLDKLRNTFPEIYGTFATEGLPIRRSTTTKRAPGVSIPADLEILTTEADLSAGRELFAAQCANCHGNAGQGGIGPNMTDEYWLHGGDMTDVVRTIYVGVPAMGMIAWLGTLSPAQIHQVASFILHELQGTNPPAAKAPQGEKAS